MKKQPNLFSLSWPVTGVMLALAVVSWFVYTPLVLLFLLLGGFNMFFFRDPERSADADPHSIIAAADGKIVEIKRVTEPYFSKSETTMVAIFLSIFDVHVQRAPSTGRVGMVKSYKGAFHDARKPEASESNEHRVMAICDRDHTIVVRQIAGLIARRIVGWHKEGDHINKGERIGMIRYGSRVEMYLPTHVDLSVKVGQRVKGGETIIGYQR